MHNGFGVIILVLGIGTILFLVLKYSLHQSEQLDEMYRSVARRWGGQSVPGGLLGRPRIKFTFAGAPARVDIYSTGGKHPKHYTQLHFTWPDAELRCEVYPESVMHGIGKMLGMTDIQVDSPDFDRQFMISGNSEEAIRRLLSRDVQSAIYKLRQFLHNDDIYFSIRSGRMLIKKRKLIRAEVSLDRFIRLGTHLHEVASLTQAAGIDFVGGAEHEATLSLAEAICQVCGDQVLSDAVFCRSCKTPHHRDCWEYYGSCSTYGCGQTKFLVERQAKRSDRRETKHPS